MDGKDKRGGGSGVSEEGGTLRRGGRGKVNREDRDCGGGERSKTDA